jgi:hypothetical protein
MSIPVRRHHLVRGTHDETEAYFRDGSKAGQFVAHRYSQMRCDGRMGKCPIPPKRAPLIVVPPKPWAIEIAPRKVYTTLHYCETCTPEIPPRALMLIDDRMKALIEQRCKQVWPHEYRPDFDAAFVRWELVTTPEYRAFLLKIERAHAGAVSSQGIPLL